VVCSRRLQLDPDVQQSLEKSFNKGFHNTRKAISDEAAILGHKEGDQYVLCVCVRAHTCTRNTFDGHANNATRAKCQVHFGIRTNGTGRDGPRVQASTRMAASAEPTWPTGKS
jgi:hypothetical protein